MRRPLVGLTLAYIAGTWLALIWRGPSLAALAAAVLVSLVCAIVLDAWDRRRGQRPGVSIFASARILPDRILARLATGSLYLSLLGGAWLAADLSLHDPAPHALANILVRPGEGLEVEGIISDDPLARPLATGPGDTADQPERLLWNFPLRLKAIRRLPDWQAARGKLWVRLALAPSQPRPQYGDRWRFSGVLLDNAHYPSACSLGDLANLPASRSQLDLSRRPQSAERLAPGAGQAIAVHPVLKWLNRRYSFQTDALGAVLLGRRQGFPPLAACLDLRQKCAGLLARGIDYRPEVVGLLQALLLGYRQELPEKIRNDFIATGCYHIFAISGQHVAILSMFIIVALQAYRVSRVSWFWILAPILIVFTVSSGMRASATRGCIMALFFFLGPLLGRKPDAISAMALTALIILVVAPSQLFDYGFLLSFIAVTGLIILCPPILQRLAAPLEPDVLRLQAERSTARWGRFWLKTLSFMLTTSLAAWLATAPLVARWFNLISPIALLANLAVIPIATLVLLAGCLSILCGSLLPILGEIFNFANVALVSLLIGLTDLLARVPGGHYFVCSPGLGSVAAWYATLVFWIYWHRKIWAWALGPLLLTLALSAGWLASSRPLEIDIINTGDQASCFINSPGGADLLIDPGSAYQSHRLIRHLRQAGVDQLKAVILTGPASSRVGGSANILEAMPVAELWVPAVSRKSRALRQALELAGKQARLLAVLSNRSSIALSGQASWIFLSPPPDQPPGAGRPAPAWLWRGRSATLLCLDGAAPAAASIPAIAAAGQPDVIIENWMNFPAVSDLTPSSTLALSAELRVICTSSLAAPEAYGRLAGSPRLVRLMPGQGIRLYWRGGSLKLERLEF